MAPIVTPPLTSLQVAQSTLSGMATTAWHTSVPLVERADHFITSGVRKVISQPLRVAMDRSPRLRSYVEKAGKRHDQVVSAHTSVTSFYTGISLAVGSARLYSIAPEATQNSFENLVGTTQPDAVAMMFQGMVVIGLMGLLRLNSAFLQEARDHLPIVSEQDIDKSFEAAETINEWIEHNANVRNTIHDLENLLHDDPKFVEYLGYDPESFSLLDMLGNSRLLESTDLYGSVGTNSAYSNHDACTVENLSDHGILAHELLHLLHFKSIKRAMNNATVDKMLQSWEHKLSKRYAFPKSTTEQLEVLRQRVPGMDLTENQRQVAMEIFFYYAELTGRAEYSEAVASHYRYALQTKRKSLRDLLPLTMYPLLILTALVGGTYFSSRTQTAKLGYYFPGYMYRYYGKDLLEAII